MFADNSSDEPEPEPVELFKPQLNTQIIDTKAKLTKLFETLTQHTDPEHPVAWDTETTSLETHSAELVGIGCCWGDSDTDIAYIPPGGIVREIS